MFVCVQLSISVVFLLQLKDHNVDMVIFRENTEDIYAGMEVEFNTPESAKLIEYLHDQFGWDIRTDSGIGIKPVSETGSKRLIRAALKFAVDRNRRNVSLVHRR